MTTNDDVTISETERIRATITGGLDRLMSVSADKVFAEPVHVGERVIIDGLQKVRPGTVVTTVPAKTVDQAQR